MADSYTTSLRLIDQTTGENPNTWGDKVDTNMQLIEDALAGYVSVTHDDSATDTLTSSNGATDEARNMTIDIAGTLTADRILECPQVEKTYIVRNGTSGGFDVTFQPTGGSGVLIPNGNTAILYCDGTDIKNALVGFDVAGAEFVLDADGDTSITADNDDQIDFKIGGTDELSLTAAKADNLDDLAALSHSDGNIIVSDGTDWVAESGSTARTSLGLVAGGAGDIWVEKAGDTMTGDLTITNSSGFLDIQNGGGGGRGQLQVGASVVRLKSVNNHQLEFHTNNTFVGEFDEDGGFVAYSSQGNSQGAGTINAENGIFDDGTRIRQAAQASEQTISGNQSVTFTSIPSWATEIVISLDQVSLPDTTPMLLRLGDSGGIETSGYLSGTGIVSDGNTTTTNEVTSGFQWQDTSGAASHIFMGHITLTKRGSGNKWVASGVLYNSTSDGVMHIVAGRKETSGALDRVQVVTTTGSPNFDGGIVGLRYS